jgi:hypothetical protein
VQSEQSKIVSETSDYPSWQISKKIQEETVSELYVLYSFEKYVEADKLLSVWEKLNIICNTLIETCSGESRSDGEEEPNTSPPYSTVLNALHT